ncbi:MAG: glycogen debranching protein GlgX [Propionibacteriaceae bacterium]|jgi:glycogen operon protein|nr:glycogen debranching protein GlgX [Propionibacteriaceae bacterium]
MTQPELPAPPDDARLGVELTPQGARFALWAPRASRVELALLARDHSQTNLDLTVSAGGVWSVLAPGVEPGQLYGYRVHGRWSPQTGQRFNPARLLLDPYARAITSGVDYAGPIHDHTSESNYLPDPTDSSMAVPLSVVVADTPPPIPLAATVDPSRRVILETHLRGYTWHHPRVPEHLRGTYAGLSYPALIDHLKSIGVTTVELLPVHHFVSEPFLVRAGLSNYWGYNTLGYFAPHAAYAAAGTMGEQVDEFKAMVSQFHQAGLEVFLDVVYNHTGEGNHEGPTLSFRGIDHAGYYRLTDDLHNDYDVTGCGNSVDTSQPGVLRLVLDSLRYWTTHMGVDGFRFDLAPTLIRDRQHAIDQDHPFKRALRQDPVLSQVTVIAEPWDIGPDGYQLGAWGEGWGEWNGRFRDCLRDYWRGASGGVQELATRLSGSPDLFEQGHRPTTASINLVTAHDGFTLRDLVSYNTKHNQANRESNRDGSNDNRSWNCGVEGETDDRAVLALRQRQVRNFLTSLVLSHGTPMLTAGDEMGRTQGGNNNAYCQDSPISWSSWDPESTWPELIDFTSDLISLRQAHPALRPSGFLHRDEVLDAQGEGLGRPDLAWLNGYDGEMKTSDWHDPGRHLLGMYCSTAGEAFLTWFHSGPDPIGITLPGQPWGQSYHVLLHTGEDDELPSAGFSLLPGHNLVLPGRTVVVMRAEAPEQATQPPTDAVD